MGRKLTSQQSEELLSILKIRFEKNMRRHPNLVWDKIQAKLLAQPDKLWSLNEMDITDGEPDVIAHDEITDTYTFIDCAAESPKGRRSLCYDHAALEARKEYKPADSAVNMALEMGVDLLDETQYRKLQTLGEFDLKTSSWIQTPTEIRKLGGALFCDRRYDTVFVYHNGASSYYAARAFRAMLKV